MKCGTSVGANVMEAQEAVSKRDFINKLSISLKEANETRYWCRLVIRANVLSQSQVDTVAIIAEENWRMLTRIITTAKASL